MSNGFRPQPKVLLLFAAALLLALSFDCRFFVGRACAQTAAAPLAPETVWQQGQAALKDGDSKKALLYFRRYHENFFGTPRAEEALWQAAQAAKRLAEEGGSSDWEEAAALFRTYSVEFSRSARAPEAAFEIGLAHQRMRRFREALSYFTLFEKKFPASPLLQKVHFLQADTLLMLGRVPEAAVLYRKIQANAGNDLQRGKAMIGLADTQAAAGDYGGALITYAAISEQDPEFHLRDPELLRKQGSALLALGREEGGRAILHHYLNLAGKTPARGEVFFALAESYRRSGDGLTALKLYEWVLDENEPEHWLARLARFRQAEYYDDPKRKLPKWQQRVDLNDSVGDQPFLAVIDAHRSEPIAQDARRALFRRYLIRKDFESAYEIGRSYLRNTESADKTNGKDPFVGEILVGFAETLLASKDYEKLYRLYVDEHRHVSALTQGRFLFLVGQALESMGLYEQASAVYFRAQALELSEEDKAGLYFRRAELYLVLKDLGAADRLLVFLRGLYKGGREAAEAFFLSARLAELKGAKKQALDYYGRAAFAPASPAKKALAGAAQLRLLLGLGLHSQVTASLERFRREQVLDAAALQDWYRQLGLALVGNNERQALAAYQAGVGKGMPGNTRAAQEIHLELAKLFAQGSEPAKSRAALVKAQAGPDSLLKKKAQERLNQLDIEQAKK